MVPHKLSVIAGEAENSCRNFRQDVGSRFSRSAGSRSGTLKEHWFLSLRHARQAIEDWRQEYNDERPAIL